MHRIVLKCFRVIERDIGMEWIALVLLYGILKGVREILKKKALGRNTVMEVLFMYTLLSFIMVIPSINKAFGLRPVQYGLIAVKSFVIFLAWLCSFHALSAMPVSLYGVLDLSRVLFSTVLGIVFLKESMPLPRIIGFILVCIGLYSLKGLKKREKKEDSTIVELDAEEENGNDSVAAETVSSPSDTQTVQIARGEAKLWEKALKNPTLVIILAFLSSLLNGVSGTMDKILMKDMNESQLQFWYMLFLVLFYGIYIIATKTPIRLKSIGRNPWIWLLSVAFVIADRALFIANGYQQSQVTLMTLLKQAGCVVTIIGGKLFFHEKQVKYKLCCAAIIVAGIVIAVIPWS